MLNALCIGLDGTNPLGWSRALASMSRQGFLPATQSRWAGGQLHAWRHPTQTGTPVTQFHAASNLACSIGTLWYRGHFGGNALTELLADADGPDGIDEAQLHGNFAVFVHTPHQSLLFNDALGLVRVYASADGRFYSTSWLASCAYAGTVELHEAAAIEYVLLGASHSDATVARGVTTLPLGRAFDLDTRHTRSRQDPGDGEASRNLPSMDHAVEAIATHLCRLGTDILAAFPGGVRMALSGGFDSRLVLAALLACGGNPELFVYGAPNSTDARLARRIAHSIGSPVESIDKAAWSRGRPCPGLEQWVENALFFDGLPNDGICDDGTDRQTRLAQTAGHCVALNGGGGEILRNFFQLPGRTLPPRGLVRTFYRQFDPDVFRHSGALDAYQQRMAASIVDMVGHVRHGKLGRQQVERVYPRFRCHYWMAVNNSVAVRHGHYLTPLVDPPLVALASRLPLAWKNAGRLESRVITQLHAGIADQPSDHGFCFSNGPDARARMAAWATRMRPVSLRPLINATRRRARGQRVSTELMDHARSLLPGTWQLDPVLRLDRLPDDNAFARALAVEVLWRELLPGPIAPTTLSEAAGAAAKVAG